MLLLIRAVTVFLIFLSQLIISLFLPLLVSELLVELSFLRLPSLQLQFWLLLKLQLRQQQSIQLRFERLPLLLPSVKPLVWQLVGLFHFQL